MANIVRRLTAGVKKGAGERSPAPFCPDLASDAVILWVRPRCQRTRAAVFRLTHRRRQLAHRALDRALAPV
jgi:hypothetical protein